MSVKKIVLNASPLILLCNSELVFILPELFEEIVVPNAVWQEIFSGPHADRATHVVPTLNWLSKVSTIKVPEVIRWDVGMVQNEGLHLYKLGMAIDYVGAR